MTFIFSKLWHLQPDFSRQAIISLINKWYDHKRKIKREKIEYYKHHNPQKFANYLYKNDFGYDIDFKHPRDLNEKIQYLQFFTDTTRWSLLADKYRVREYVKECGCEEILVPLIGKYSSFDDIDFDTLPPRFVIKTNKGSGDVVLVKDKHNLDIDFIREKISNMLNYPFGLQSAEPHYLRIPPCIIVEKFLGDGEVEIVDYKVWCFHGKPYCILTCSNRSYSAGTLDLNCFDLDWNRRDEWISSSYRNYVTVPKPHNLNLLLKYASILSKGFPQVRVDFYDIKGRLYFGEMTFTSACGRMKYFTKEFLKQMGDMVQL